MRRYISNKGLRVTYQTDVTQNFPGSDGAIVTITKLPLIELVFQPLIGGEYGITPYDMPAAYQAYARVTGQVPTYANVRDVTGSDGLVANQFLADRVMVPVHGFHQGAKKLGMIKTDETVIESEEAIDPASLLWVFDVDMFCEQNKVAAGLETEIEAFLDSPASGQDHVKVDAPVMAVPFQGYDRLKKPGRVAQLASELGVNPDLVIAYEKQNPRDISEEIVADMDALKLKQQETAQALEDELVQA